MMSPASTCSKPVHVVALNGSPHREGNTATLMQWVVEGCIAEGATTDWLHVVDYDIQYCLGCHACLRTGACPVPDDFPAVRDRIVAADGIVAGSPVYGGRPTAQLKTLMDRMTLLHLYTESYGGLRSVGVATSGIAPTRGVARELASFFGQRSGTVGATTASLSGGYRSLRDRVDDRLRGRAHRTGRRLVTQLRGEPHLRIPPLDYLWIRFLKRTFVSQLVTRNPEEFAGVVEIWRTCSKA